MARDLTLAMELGLTSRVIRPVLIGRLDIAGDPVSAWTGPGIYSPTGTGDTALDSQVFEPVAPFVDMGDIVENQSIGGPVTLTFSAHDIDEELLRQVVRDKRAWRGKPAWLWIGLISSNEYSIVANPVRIKTGVITSMVVKRLQDSSTIITTIDQDFGNARSAPFIYRDHPRLYPSDTFTTYMVKLANKPQGFTNRDINPMPITESHRGIYGDD